MALTATQLADVRSAIHKVSETLETSGVEQVEKNSKATNDKFMFQNEFSEDNKEKEKSELELNLAKQVQEIQAQEEKLEVNDNGVVENKETKAQLGVVDDDGNVLPFISKKVKATATKLARKRINIMPVGYCDTMEESTPIKKEDIDYAFVTQEMIRQAQQNATIAEKLKTIQEREKELLKRLIQRDEEDEQKQKRVETENKVFYSNDSVALADGSIANFTKAVKTAEFLDDIKNTQDVSKIRQIITLDILKHFGGAENIKSIIVSDEVLIINNIMYLPKVPKGYLDDVALPLNIENMICNNQLAGLFEWKRLYNMTGLTKICIDSTQFYYDYIAPELKNSDIMSLLKLHRGMCYVSVGDCVLDKNAKGEDNKENLVNARKRLAIHSRFAGLSDGYNFNIYAGTNGIQGFFCNSLKDYAMNRGNKGFFRYTIGTTVRAVGAVAGIGLNLGTHIVGGAVKGISSYFSENVSNNSQNSVEETDYV